MSQYSIEQFSKITGLNKILIRTWENRYGFLKPKRTNTNIRFYDNYMLTQGIRYSVLVNNGHKISKLMKFNDQELKNLIEEALITANDDDTKNEIIISKFVESSINYDQDLFNKTYNTCIKKFGITSFYKDIIVKTMKKISVLYLNSEITPAHEHFISENMRIKLSAEIEINSITEKNKENWILFLPENEYHDIGLLFTHLTLKEKGYNVIYLGQNVPRENLTSIKNNKDNILFFISTKRSEKFISELFDFLLGNFEDSKIYFVSNKNSPHVENNKIKYITEIDQFFEIIKKKKK